MSVSRKFKSITTAAAAAAGAAVIVTGTAGAAAGTVSGVASAAPAGVQLAAADTSSTSGTAGPSNTAGSSGSSGSGSSGSTDPTGPADSAERPDAPKPGKDLATTPITGSEVDKVVAAVKSKDAAVTAAGVVKLSDGSYRVEGTKSGERVMVEVSKDLATVTVRTPGPGGPGRHGGPGGDRGTDVTGDQLTTIKAAVTAKDSTVTLDRVVKLDDGSYVGFGTKGSGDNATRVFATISGDLKTITVQAAPERPGHPHAPGDR